MILYNGSVLGAILIPPPLKDSDLVLCRGRAFNRIGAVTASYSPQELVVRARAVLEAPVPLKVSHGELNRFLDIADEDAFTDLLLVPLFRIFGFGAVSRKGHRDRTLEFGQDLRGMKYQLPTGHLIYFAAQVKVGTIGYSAERPQSIDKIAEQLRMALQTKMMDWQSRSWHRPDHVFLAASGSIVEGARGYLAARVCDDQMKILFWDRDLILEACSTRGLPEALQRDITRYLEKTEEGEGG
jgi:hypothetical protein